jgi:DNA invertase Pin-like site-specific DNA recombinase
MRYGVVRISPDLPPTSVQRRRIEATGCDVVLDDGARSLGRLTPGLSAGDEVLVHGLEAFDLTTGELSRLLRRFFETGVTLKIVGGSQIESLAPQGPMPRALALLADHEARRPRAAERRRSRPADSPLTQHQLKFARQMHRRGHSMRAIGLIFQLSPSEMATLLREAPGADEGDDCASVPDAPDPPPRVSP